MVGILPLSALCPPQTLLPAPPPPSLPTPQLTERPSPCSNRGGYNVGSLYYYAGSKLPIEWWESSILFILTDSLWSPPFSLLACPPTSSPDCQNSPCPLPSPPLIHRIAIEGVITWGVYIIMLDLNYQLSGKYPKAFILQFPWSLLTLSPTPRASLLQQRGL